MSKRLLVVNVHFAPNSFGGATVVAENTAGELASRHGWTVLVVTSLSRPGAIPYSVVRYRAKGVDVVGVNLPSDQLGYTERYDNPRFNEQFRKIIRAFKPDVAHVHCVQDIGATFLAELAAAQVPTAITVHDCWWLCERQFMINSAGRYCHQNRIDATICNHCVADPGATARRQQVLREILGIASLYLFPSKFHMDLHIANGLPPGKCSVNKNGINPPALGFRKRPITDPNVAVRFGFVGGPGPIKGGPLIVSAFNELEESNYELVLVDALQNIGKTWGLSDWRIPGRVRIEPAYTTESMDRFFAGIDVLLFPSQWKESFGLTVREALARDIWVVTTDAGGVVEDCRFGVNATAIPMAYNSTVWGDAIRDCLSRNMDGYNNPHRSEINHIAQQADELSKILSSLMSHTSPTGEILENY